MYKIVLKVICGMRLEWKYFCSVPESIYTEFINSIDRDTLDVNAYLVLWARQDWGVTLKMSIDDDIDELKSIIVASSRRAYSELYVFESYGLIPNDHFWISLWVSSHMKDETERRKLL